MNGQRKYTKEKVGISMEELFENKNIVYMSASEVFQVNNISELNEKLFGEEYNKLSEEEKIEKRINHIKNEMLVTDMDIISKKIIKEYSQQLLNCIVVDDEKLYYFGICNNDIARIYEKKDSHIFLSRKIMADDYFEIFNNLNDKYIYIGDKYNKILKQYIKESND